MIDKITISEFLENGVVLLKKIQPIKIVNIVIILVIKETSETS